MFHRLNESWFKPPVADVLVLPAFQGGHLLGSHSRLLFVVS